MEVYDIIIVGSGPAGFTAALYTTRANLKTLVLAGSSWGGQLMLTTVVENYPGFPDGILGPDLMDLFRKQAERFGAKVINEDLKEIDFSKGPPFKVSANGKTYEGKSVIIATGADPKLLGVPGEKERIGRGVSTCAVCDAPFFKGKNVIVVGGGDTAMEDGIFLTNFANSVIVVHRRDEFRASQIMVDRAKKNPRIKFMFNTEVKEILGQDKVTGVKLVNNKTNEVKDMPIDGVFVAIGHFPNTSVFKGVDMDEKGYIKIYDHTRTNIKGVFVAGDVHDYHYKQAVTAAGFGSMAALEAEKWLRSQSS